MFGLQSPKARFEATVREYSAVLYRYAFWLCRDRGRAEDLVQETFARASRAFDDVRSPEAIRGWLFTICRNEHARTFERKRPEIVHDPEQALAKLSQSSTSDLEVRSALEVLPLLYREPLMLQVLGGFSAREIAEMVGTTEAAILTRLTRARKALREVLMHDVRPEKEATG